MAKRNWGSLFKAILVVALLVWIGLSMHGCIAELNKPKPVYAKSDIYLRAESIRDWMGNNGYEEVKIKSNKNSGVASVAGYFTRHDIRYEVIVSDSTPQAGDTERITITPTNSFGDVGKSFSYSAKAAPAADTAYQNLTTNSVALYQ